MKKTISMLSVAVRSSLYKICLILIGMSAVQVGMFCHTYLKFDYSDTEGMMGQQKLGQAFGVTWTLESLIEKSRVGIIFLAAFVLICIVLDWAQNERKGTKTMYFYDRLAVSKAQRFWAWTGYNSGCFLLLLFAQILTVYCMGCIFEYLVPVEYESRQMYFMAFYKSSFLHSLLPMAEVWKWIRNLCIFTACAMEIAGAACIQRKAWGRFLLMAMIVFGFRQEIASYGMDAVMILVSAVCIGLNIYKLRVLRQEAQVQKE